MASEALSFRFLFFGPIKEKEPGAQGRSARVFGVDVEVDVGVRH